MCDHCNDTGSLSKNLTGYLDCTHCNVATARAKLNAWTKEHAPDTLPEDAWVIYQHGKAALCWISVADQLPEQRERAYQVIACCMKKYGEDTNYPGQGVKGVYQDWVIRRWPQNFTYWMPLLAVPNE